MESLIYCYNNNAAELYNFILTKCVDVKRVSFALEGSYELIYNAAIQLWS